MTASKANIVHDRTYHAKSFRCCRWLCPVECRQGAERKGRDEQACTLSTGAAVLLASWLSLTLSSFQWFCSARCVEVCDRWRIGLRIAGVMVFNFWENRRAHRQDSLWQNWENAARHKQGPSRQLVNSWNVTGARSVFIGRWLQESPAASTIVVKLVVSDRGLWNRQARSCSRPEPMHHTNNFSCFCVCALVCLHARLYHYKLQTPSTTHQHIYCDSLLLLRGFLMFTYF